MLSWLPVAPEATNVIGVPLTVMVLPAAKSVPSESVVAAPDSSVAPVMGAVVAEAATSDVSLSVFIDAVSEDCKFSVVAAVSTPIANEPAGGGVVVVAVSSIDSVVPSGRLKMNLTLSPLLGLTPPRSTVAAGGTPAGCVMVAPVSDELTEDNFRPNAEPSSATLVTVVVADGDVTASRPIPRVP